MPDSHALGIIALPSDNTAKLLYLIMKHILSESSKRPVPLCSILDGEPCTGPPGEGPNLEPSARQRAWCPKHIPNTGMRLFPMLSISDNAFDAMSIVRSDTSGLEGPGPITIPSGAYSEIILFSHVSGSSIDDAGLPSTTSTWLPRVTSIGRLTL